MKLTVHSGCILKNGTYISRGHKIEKIDFCSDTCVPKVTLEGHEPIPVINIDWYKKPFVPQKNERIIYAENETCVFALNPK